MDIDDWNESYTHRLYEEIYGDSKEYIEKEPDDVDLEDYLEGV